MKLSQAQREVLVALARDGRAVYRDDEPPYTCYLRDGDRERVVTSTVNKLVARDLLQVGDRERFIRRYELTDAGREVAAQLTAKEG